MAIKQYDVALLQVNCFDFIMHIGVRSVHLQGTEYDRPWALSLNITTKKCRHRPILK